MFNLFESVVVFVFENLIKKSRFVFDSMQASLLYHYKKTKDRTIIEMMLVIAIIRYKQITDKKVSLSFEVDPEDTKGVEGRVFGYASPTVDQMVRVSFDINNIEKSIENNEINIDKDDSGFSIYQIALHELWHVKQFSYLFDKGGIDLVKSVLEKEKEFEYGQGPLELGAIRYQNSNTMDKQNLERLLV